MRDDALVRSAELAARYISERHMPDKAIDVLDTACARVRVSLGAKPGILEELEEKSASLQREIISMERDICRGVFPEECSESSLRHSELKAEFNNISTEIEQIRQKWQKEKELVESIIKLRTSDDHSLEQDKPLYTSHTPVNGPVNTPASKECAENNNDSGSFGQELNTPSAPKETYEDAFANKAKNLDGLLDELESIQGEQPLVFYEVCPALISEIVAEWTGVPIGKLNGDEASVLQSLGSRIEQRIKGQDHAISAIERAVLATRTGLNNPNMPSGIFLLVGPSGVGKTETALALADELFGGERFLISINMSEFQEKHTISRLIGSPPGYVGYGEGGRLTEAVRRQPYSAVLFDEVEKAHPDVLNLFYQMFDKGVLADGEGREIDFRNTLIFMTSNLGSEIVTSLCESGESCESGEPPTPEELLEALRPTLAQFFKPALLGRMTVVPYTTISPGILKELVGIKLNKIAERMHQRHRLPLFWSDEVVENIVKSCTAVDSGARNIDHVINAGILPGIATSLLGTFGKQNKKTTGLHIDLDPELGKFIYTFDDGY